MESLIKKLRIFQIIILVLAIFLILPISMSDDNITRGSCLIIQTFYAITNIFLSVIVDYIQIKNTNKKNEQEK